jgi:hypothetical protein
MTPGKEGDSLPAHSSTKRLSSEDMASPFAIYAVGNALARYLTQAYQLQKSEGEIKLKFPCEFRLISSGELKDDDSFSNTLTLFLHRVTTNEHLRNVSQVKHPAAAFIPLSLDLHYLMTMWTDNAEAEHSILAWAMKELHQHPVLDLSALSSSHPDARWVPADNIQIISEDLSDEDVMRIWDALNPSYRLSVSYVARAVKIDADPVATAGPVVATRFTFTDRENPQ